ncbi:MAG: hypothetical protein Aurels2KO_32760 [Aureliella sp.]
MKANSQAERTTRIKLVDGSATTGQVFHAVAKDVHWLTAEVASIIASVATADASEPITREQISDLVKQFPDVFTYSGTSTNPQAELIVHNDRLAEALSDAKSGLRQWLAQSDGQPLSSLSRVKSTWGGVSDSPRRIVICMHGLHGLASGAEAVAKALHQRTNLPAYVFAYPNDGPLNDSARMLKTHLDQLHRRYPNSRLTLVSHSMGGLVSRAVLESPEFATDNHHGVDQLIQVCPPNHGSAIAEYGPLLEGVEQISKLMDRGSRKDSRLLINMIKDGFNEAPEDLRPRSEFLNTLNANRRAQGVRYSIIAGTEGPLRPVVHTLLGEVWSLISENTDEPMRLNSRVTSLLECDDLKHGSGDGVVSLKSARLSGVADFETLPINHLTWGQLESTGGKLMISKIASRLGISL